MKKKILFLFMLILSLTLSNLSVLAVDKQPPVDESTCDLSGLCTKEQTDSVEQMDPEEQTDPNEDADYSENKIFLDGKKGNDDNDGSSKDMPIKTFKKAKELAESYKNISTIYIIGEVNVSGDVSLEGTNAKIYREENYSGNLFKVSKEKTATFKDIEIYGHGVDFPFTMVNDAGALIYSEGNLNIEKGTVLSGNGRRDRGNFKSLGGAIQGEGGFIDMSGGTIEGNSAYLGGGVYLRHTKFTMTGGTIKNNTALSQPELRNDWSGSGGGVALYENATFELKNGKIIENNARENGGGVTVGTTTLGNESNKFIMTGGKINSNKAGSPGGGIFVQGSYADLFNKAIITSGEITNNEMTGTGHGNKAFGGGGIYVNGDNRSEFRNGQLYLENVLVTNNTADQEGGGYAGCPITHTNFYDNSLFIYENKSKQDKAHDIYILSAYNYGTHSGKAVYNIPNTMLDGSPNKWNDDSGTERRLNLLNGVLETHLGADQNISLTNEVDRPIDTEQVKVIITGNSSSTRGGGVGSNGDVTIGHEVELLEINVQKKWDIEGEIPSDPVEIEVLRRSSNDEEYEYVGYETITSDKNGKWEITINNLPKVDPSGNNYEYIVKERNIEGYSGKVTGDSENGFVITNTEDTPLTPIEPGTTSVDVKKEWIGEKQESVTVNLLADGEKVDSVELNEGNNWKHTFEDLQVVHDITDEKAIEYMVEEVEVDGYETSIAGNAALGFVITNTEDPKPEDPKPEDPKPEDPKPEDPKPEDPKNENLPKTGVSNQIPLYGLLMLLSGSLLVLLNKKKQLNKK
ncbi:Cna B-type domain-containing protein [Erysipelothrix tonsillarum]|uniref:Cna B-type domain-containing protein n=1 Tax=Erysipelothrix tonsillarum TaxID=38402 RepID=UPI0039C7FBF0